MPELNLFDDSAEWGDNNNNNNNSSNNNNNNSQHGSGTATTGEAGDVKPPPPTVVPTVVPVEKNVEPSPLSKVGFRCLVSGGNNLTFTGSQIKDRWIIGCFCICFVSLNF